MFPRKTAVHPAGSFIIHTFKMQDRLFPFRLGGKCHFSAVPDLRMELLVTNPARPSFIGKRNVYFLRSRKVVHIAFGNSGFYIIEAEIPLPVQIQPLAPYKLGSRIVFHIKFRSCFGHVAPILSLITEVFSVFLITDYYLVQRKKMIYPI
ncbi:hypothetical protein D3C73_1259690 [compost metagenome]